MLFVIYPIAFIPAALAYLARWAFDTQPIWRFSRCWRSTRWSGLIVYRVALDSAVGAAERLKEKMIAALSAGEGPIAGYT